MLELEGGRIGQPCEKLSPLHLTTLLVPSIDVKTLFLGSSRLAAHGGGRLASQIVLLHEIFCFWCHALVTRDKAVNAPPTPLPWCSPARFIPPLDASSHRPSEEARSPPPHVSSVVSFQKAKASLLLTDLQPPKQCPSHLHTLNTFFYHTGSSQRHARPRFSRSSSSSSSSSIAHQISAWD